MDSPLTFIHSFSTRPIRGNCYGLASLDRLLMQVWYFSLSVAYIKRSGGRIVLHTDKLGYAVLGHLPYDEIHLTLESMADDIHFRFWAAGKFVALAATPTPCVHIDGDVFIKTPSLIDSIKRLVETNDILVQSTDDAKMYALEVPMFASHEQFCREHHCLPDGRDALNTGILGFSNSQVKDAIVENYLDIVRFFSKQYEQELDNGDMLTPDLIAEQKMVEGFSRERNLRVAMLLNEDGPKAEEIGYQHVFTINKLHEIPKCRETLRAVSPEIYRTTLALCGHLPDIEKYRKRISESDSPGQPQTNNQ